MSDRVTAILLAGGESRRMGFCKQTLVIAGKPVIVHCVEALTQAGVSRIMVVVGKYEDAIRQALRNLEVDVVKNDLPNADMADSVRVGLATMGASSTGVMICLSDHPLVKPGTMKILMETHRVFPESIIIPIYQERNGHPVIFPTERLKHIHHGGTLRDIIQTHQRRVIRIPVDDPGVFMDMDTPDDYQLILNFHSERMES
ncbi:MAG: nucleotidyltransferase family protein [Proteobacteria bacterium]|nr:nucleotidyltransferase family protein [Pseudomonadota bacterium]